MEAEQQLDVRMPMGLLFAILGLLLIAYGLLSDPAIYERHSFGQNVNLHWGIVFTIFGGAMVALAKRAAARRRA